MTEYIERESVLGALSVFNDYDNGNEHFLYGIETAREIVESVQAIDAHLVEHGKWIDVDDFYLGISYCCSVCKKKTHTAKSYDIRGNEYQYAYCPHCGAKMEAGDEK